MMMSSGTRLLCRFPRRPTGTKLRVRSIAPSSSQATHFREMDDPIDCGSDRSTNYSWHLASSGDMLSRSCDDPSDMLSRSRDAHDDPSKLTSPDFSERCHESKSVFELCRALLIYRLCRIQPVVRNAETLLRVSNRMLGQTMTNLLIRHTFFGHFCAGEDVFSIRPRIEKLRESGIGGILDYAAECDGGLDDIALETDKSFPSSSVSTNQPARIYTYKSEELCDRHLRVFETCIEAVRDVTPGGFAAIKITALGNPLLLERMSTAITEAQKLFEKFDTDRKGFVSRDQFRRGYQRFFHDAVDRLPGLLDRLDPDETDAIDYIEWSRLLKPCDLARITRSCREVGPLALAAPSEQEIRLLRAAHDRARTLARLAQDAGVRLLIDAEQSAYQPAIDNLVLDLQREFNSHKMAERPTVFHTYQCYLKDAQKRIVTDVERSKRYRYHFAAKLVRGAYMNSEREKARLSKCPSPIHDTIKETHACYDGAMEYLLRVKGVGESGLEVMCATHNQESIESTIRWMGLLGIRGEETGVHFAQLLGMSDHLTYGLGKEGFHAFKYAPYGKVGEVIPYLVRRVQENSDLFGNVDNEIELIHEELKRRLRNSS